MHQKSPEETTQMKKNRKHDYTMYATITRKVSRLHDGYDNYTKGFGHIEFATIKWYNNTINITIGGELLCL